MTLTPSLLTSSNINIFEILGEKSLKEFSIKEIINEFTKDGFLKNLTHKFYKTTDYEFKEIFKAFQKFDYTLNEARMYLEYFYYYSTENFINFAKINLIRNLGYTKEQKILLQRKYNYPEEMFIEFEIYRMINQKVNREYYYYNIIKDKFIIDFLQRNINEYNKKNNPNVIILNKEKKEIIFNNDIILGTLYIAQSLSLNYKIAPEKYKNFDGNKIFHEALDKCEELKNLVFPKRNTTPDDPEKIKFYMNEIKKQLLKIDDEKWERNPLKQLNKEGIYLESQLDEEQKKMNFKIITKNNISFFLIKNIRDAENIIEKYLKVINKLLSI